MPPADGGGSSGTAGGSAAGGTGTAGGGAAGGAGTAGGAAGGAAGGVVVIPAPVADLRADSNRDGLLDLSDDTDETLWNTTRGAIILANLDDDSSRCSTSTQVSDLGTTAS